MMINQFLSLGANDWPEPEEPRLPEPELKEFCARHFAARARYLAATAGQLPTAPLYLFDREGLRRKIRQFRKTWELKFPGNRIFYALKSNHYPGVAATAISEGLGLDVSSGTELKKALELGADRIIFSGPGKTTEELQLAVRHQQKVTIMLDSYGELERLATVSRSQNHQTSCGVRLNQRQQGSWQKFGIPLEELAEFVRSAAGHRSLAVEALQFHCSWNLTPEKHVLFCRDLGDRLEHLPGVFRAQLRLIDFGGGFWPEEGEWLQYNGTGIGRLRQAAGTGSDRPLDHFRLPTMPLREFTAALKQAFEIHLSPRTAAEAGCEPGRWLCHEAMHLLLRVVDRKSDDLVITDGGSNSIGWERFESDYFPILNLSRPELKERCCRIMGSLCTPQDLWGGSYWGHKLKEGDYLLIPNQGAYTYSLRQNFIKPAARVVELPPCGSAMEGFQDD